MKNGNTLTQRTISKNPRVTTVACPQNNYFQMIKRKRRSKTAAQAHIQILSPPVAEVVIDNEIHKQKSDKRSLEKVIQKAKTGKRKQKN